MENYDPSKPYSGIAMRNGLIAAAIVIVYNLIVYIADLSTARGMSIVGTLVILAVLIFFTRQSILTYRNNIGGFITYGRAFGVGMLLVLVFAVVSSIWSYIQLEFLTPDLMQDAVEMQRENMEDRGMSEEEIDQAMKMVSYFQAPAAMAFMAFLANMFMGLVISLIMAAVLKNDPPEA